MELKLGPPGRRAVLALLAMAGGRSLTRGELASALWGDRCPRSAANMIQAHVMHLRRVLEPERRARKPGTVISAAGDGYALQVPAEQIDLGRFRCLVGAAAGQQEAGDGGRAAALLTEAVGLWRGSPLADLPMLVGHPWAVALEVEHRVALTRYGEVMIAVGAASDALPVLVEAAAARQLDEVVHSLLIRAYHAAGQRAQAFAAYDTIRRRLAGELGVDPGPELAAAHESLLHEDPGLGAPGRASRHVAPAQLPPDNETFTGRVEQLRQLDALLPAERTVAIAAIDGTAGVGKTALAVHWAHRMADRFPDGQLYVNLRGFEPTGTAMAPAEAVRGFLEALAVPAGRIPASLDAQVGLYRSLLAGRRVLVVLDNARDADQVRALLPGAPGCAVVVTSRNQLTSLVAHGARPLTLDLLSGGEARQYLVRRLGQDRIAADAGAAQEIIDRCARLPLALAIVAATAAARPAFPLSSFAADLRPTQRGLDTLSGADPAANVQAVLSWSYRSLGQGAARLFRLLGLHPGPDLAAPAAASLAGLAVEDTTPLLAELAFANLITRHAPGRYGFHDLLRAYAAGLARVQDPEPERRAAVHRMLDHYLHTAHAAAIAFTANSHAVNLPAALPGTVVVAIAGLAEARAWFAAEDQVLLAAVQLAAAADFDTHAAQLPRSLVSFLHRSERWRDMAATQTTAVAAAERLADQACSSYAHRSLGRACAHLDRYDEALAHLRRAQGLYSALGDQVGLALTNLDLGQALERRGRHAEAIDHARSALDLFRATGHRQGQATALNNIGWCHAMLGQHDKALVLCEQALALHQQIGNRFSQAATLDSLGYVNQQLGHFDSAKACFQQAIDVYEELGDCYNHADTLTHLGDSHDAAGDHGSARQAWQQALRMFDALDHPEAARLRTRLRQ